MIAMATKARDAIVTATDIYLEIIDWMGAPGVGTLWPISVAATVYFMWG